MRFTTIDIVAALSTLALPQLVKAAEVHGQGAEGSTMGPVAFLWPSDRPWSASADNIGPCGSSASITNRTTFPIVRGSVALSIAEEAWNVALRIAYGNNPTTQNEFQTINGNVSEIAPGHQCYGASSIPTTVASGSNATIQLEYWSNDSGKNESFYACADITFIQAEFFTTQIPCFNVTVNDFVLPTTVSSTATSAAAAATATAAKTGAATSSSTSISTVEAGGLSAGAKAGISIGAILGAFLIIGGLFVAFRRKRQANKKDVEAANLPPMKDTASLRSVATAVQN